MHEQRRDAGAGPRESLSRGRVGLWALTPGLLIAATGVGAGDLLTASIAGSTVGLSILWAALVGAVLKFVLTEGIARWQMGTGTTVLEGWALHFGRGVQWAFLGYLLLWSFFVGGALVNACGVAGAGLLPLVEDLRASKAIWGVTHAMVGWALVRVGGYRLFEKLMSALIGLMFATVVVTAVLIRPDLPAVLRGCLAPVVPEDGAVWVLAVLGGVGGTVTLLSYGYWIRERGRTGGRGLGLCRIDLAVGYAMTALFGLAMMVIGSRVDIRRGPAVALELAGQLEQVAGPAGRWVFLLGFWGAVFSSLLGVWQGVPYLFADFIRARGDWRRGRIRGDAPAARSAGGPGLADTTAYRGYLLALAVLPLPLLWFTVQKAQLVYAVVGAFFVPLLALALLVLNNRADWVGTRYRNGWVPNLLLSVALVFFGWLGGREVLRLLQSFG